MQFYRKYHCFIEINVSVFCGDFVQININSILFFLLCKKTVIRNYSMKFPIDSVKIVKIRCSDESFFPSRISVVRLVNKIRKKMQRYWIAQCNNSIHARERGIIIAMSSYQLQALLQAPSACPFVPCSNWLATAR